MKTFSKIALGLMLVLAATLAAPKASDAHVRFSFGVSLPFVSVQTNPYPYYSPYYYPGYGYPGYYGSPYYYPSYYGPRFHRGFRGFGHHERFRHDGRFDRDHDRY